MKTRLNPLAALICGVLLVAPAMAAQEGSRQDLGLSDYRYFKVYPHIERAQKALKQNDETRALRSFEHAHQMAPESVRLTLWLAEAYRHFGHNDKAQALLESELKKRPQNADLQRALEAIPVPAPDIHTTEQLVALQKQCDATPTVGCRSEVGNYAIKLNQLDIARAQLTDAKFRHTKEGLALADNYTQRAIFLRQWSVADQGFALLDGVATLSDAQYQQWFAILLHMQRDQRILDLQSQGVMNTAGMQLSYAQSLAERNALGPLRRYLANRKPEFSTAAEEHNWMRLLATYSQQPGSAVANWPVKHAENQKYVLSTLLPIRIQQGDWQGANALLKTFPENQVLDQRLALSLARKDTQSSLRLLNQINQTRGLSAQELDTLSYQLAAYPKWMNAENKARLAKPLPTPAQRMAQARLFQGKEDCDIVRNLLGDLSPQYDAETWSHLAQCYPWQPGLALYAAQQAAAQDSSPYYQRQVGYLAHSAEDYPLAQANGVVALQTNATAEPDDASRGFALAAQGKHQEARDALEKARKAQPDSPDILRQLVYLNERLDDKPKTKQYSERVVDDIDNTLTPQQSLSDKQQEDRFAFRRIHEDSQRRWTFSYDGSFGLTPDSLNSGGSNNGVQQNKSYRSYQQFEAEYRIGKNKILDGDQLSVYSRVFAGSKDNNFVPVDEPMLGIGVRWKPLHDQVIYLAAEQQIPLDHHHGEADLMLRASASFFNGGKYSDDWHPTGNGWMAQNLYLDAAHFVKADYQIYTADYRMSWHQKINHKQTLEPYWHAQYNASTDSPYRDNTLGGVGVRLNTWFGESHYSAFPHKVSVGLEYQRAVSGHNRDTDSKNSLFLTLGARW